MRSRRDRSKGASKGAGKNKDSEVVCRHCEKEGIELPIAVRHRGTTTKGVDTLVSQESHPC